MPKYKCPICDGKKVVLEKANLQINIEKGMKNGQEIIFRKQAEQHPGVIPGDVIATIVELPHNTFRRDGNDLHTELRITLIEALLGFKRTITQLDGREIVVSRDDVTSPFQVIIIIGEGMPHHNIPSSRGDMLITVKVDLPTKITKQQREVLENLL